MANRNENQVLLVSYSFLTILSKDDSIILQAKHNSHRHLICNIHMCCTLLYLLDYLEYPPQLFVYIRHGVLRNQSKKDYWTSKKKVAPQSVTKIKAVIVMFYSHFVAILKSDSDIQLTGVWLVMVKRQSQQRQLLLHDSSGLSGDTDCQTFKNEINKN